MESSRVFDAPQNALQPELERRLARVFCFLRQHERKSRAARKVAELQRLSLGVGSGGVTGLKTAREVQQQRQPHSRSSSERSLVDDAQSPPEQHPPNQQPQPEQQHHEQHDKEAEASAVAVTPRDDRSAEGGVVGGGGGASVDGDGGGSSYDSASVASITSGASVASITRDASARSDASDLNSMPAADSASVLSDQRDLLGELALLGSDRGGGGSGDTGDAGDRESGSASTKKSRAHRQQQQPSPPHGNRREPAPLSPAHSTQPLAPPDRHALMLELGREIRELQRGILPSAPLALCADAAGSGAATTTVPGCITAADLLSAMRAMHRTTSKNEVQWMIWEADDDLDGCIDWLEFRSCYARALVDRHGLEPNQLYHLAQFLLCDTDESFTVSVLELKAELKRLPGTDHLASRLLATLKDDAEQQLLQKLTLSEYLDVMLADLPPPFTKF